MSKKVCRDSDHITDENGVNVNAKCRRAAEELKLPFMDKLEKLIVVFAR